jgi:hypothetical protein
MIDMVSFTRKQWLGKKKTYRACRTLPGLFKKVNVVSRACGGGFLITVRMALFKIESERMKVRSRAKKLTTRANCGIIERRVC